VGTKIESLCGGRGICGKCKVVIEEGAENLSKLTNAEKSKLSDKEISRGYRLACCSLANGDLTVRVPEESRYCLYCGAMLKDDPQAVDDSASAGEKDDIDFDSRVLCIDGNCIGIIVNGKCNICGKRHKGKKK